MVRVRVRVRGGPGPCYCCTGRGGGLVRVLLLYWPWWWWSWLWCTVYRGGVLGVVYSDTAVVSWPVCVVTPGGGCDRTRVLLHRWWFDPCFDDHSGT